MSGARQLLRLQKPFAMRRGGALIDANLAYETWGELSPAHDNAVLLFTGLSPSAHATSSADDPSPGWWEQIVGPGRAIDTSRYFVVCVNSLGSCFGSTGPASLNPSTGERYGLTFPVLSIEDIAAGGAALLDHLRIERLHTVLGCSMGGLTALAFAMMFPQRSAGLVSVSSGARARPFAIALRSLQREMIRRDPAWQDGNYNPGHGPIEDMRLARKLGMITYRSAKEWDQRFGRERVATEHAPGDLFCLDFEVESYLEAHAAKFTGQFDANCYLYLSRAMDLFDIAEHGGTVEHGLARVEAERALVVGVETDFLFPIELQGQLAEGLRPHVRDVVFVSLDSLQGHDAFLVDIDRFRPVFAQYFA
ncbi:MAG: homoserine O-acetyltransferase [Pseudomonadota bacterium]